MTRVEDGDPRCGRPLCTNRIAVALHGQSKYVEARSNIAYAARGKCRDTPGPGHAPASRRMSLSTPAAVTSAPAPGPVMTSGFALYRAVVNTR